MQLIIQLLTTSCDTSMTTSCQNVENNTNQMQAHQLIYHIVPSKHPYPRKGPPPVLWFFKVLRVIAHHAKFLRSESEGT